VRNLYPLIEELIESEAKTPEDLASFKRRVSKKYQIPYPSNIGLLKTYHELLKKGRIKKSGKIEYWDLKPDYVPGEVFEI